MSSLWNFRLPGWNGTQKGIDALKASLDRNDKEQEAAKELLQAQWYNIREVKAAELTDKAILLAQAYEKLNNPRKNVYIAIANRLITYRLNLSERSRHATH